jgi:hypothetical protein
VNGGQNSDTPLLVVVLAAVQPDREEIGPGRWGHSPVAEERPGAGVAEAEDEWVEASSEGCCGSGRRPLLLGLIGVGVSGRSRLVTSLSGTAFLGRLVAPDLGVERSGEPCGVTVGFIGWSRGMGAGIWRGVKL